MIYLKRDLKLEALHGITIGVGLVLLAFAFSATAADSQEDAYTAQFTEDGKLIRPAGWREWVLVGIGFVVVSERVVRPTTGFFRIPLRVFVGYFKTLQLTVKKSYAARRSGVADQSQFFGEHRAFAKGPSRLVV